MFEIVGKKNTAICYAKVVEDEAIEQIRRMCDYEFTDGSRIRIMPDVHAGKGCTIGTTMTVTDKAVPNDELWQAINHHRSTLTSMNGVDYSVNIRRNIQLIPPKESLADWENDYETMSSAMIYGEKSVFEELLESMNRLELLFKKA